MAIRQTNLLVKTVVPQLNRLGYRKSDMFFEEPCQRQYSKKFQGEADILVSVNKEPMIVVEIKPKTREMNLAIEEGKLYALNYKLGVIIPYIIAWAGTKKQMFKVQIVESFKIEFIPTEHLLTRGEITGIAESAKKEIASEDILKIETLVTIFEKAHQAIKDIGRPKFTDDEAVFALNKFILQELHNKEAKKIMVKPISEQARRRLEEVFSWYRLTELEGYALATAYRQFVTRNFVGKGYGWVDTKEIGRYLTPTPVIDFMIRMVNLKPMDKVIDFACGSGGFLGRILAHLQEKTNLNSYLRSNIFGCDIDSFSVSTSKTYIELLLPEKQENLNIFHHNALWSEAIHSWEKKEKLNLKNIIKEGNFDVVISNPPGGRNYNLDHEDELKKLFPLESSRKKLQNAPLFIQRAIQLAKKGGKICLIVPDSALANISLKYLQEHIFKTCQVKAVISLPRGTFANVPSKMSILYMIKTKKPSLKKPIFLATVGESEETDLESELKEILKNYKKFK